MVTGYVEVKTWVMCEFSGSVQHLKSVMVSDALTLRNRGVG